MSLIQKDTTLTKIFVGGLPYHTTDQSLREFFDQFGEIEEAVVITDRQTGKSRGYGFVTMVDSSSAEKACEDPNPIIDGRKANVNLAYLGAKPRVLPTGFQVDPLAMKTDIPGYCAQLPAVPQYRYVYPTTTAYMTSRGGIVPMMQTQQVQSPVQAATALQRSLVVDCAASAPAVGLTAHQIPSGYEAAYQYAAAAGHMTPMAYPYMTAAGMTPTAAHMAALQQSHSMHDKI